MGRNRHSLLNTQDDKELGIERNKIEPIKFVSSIDSKPVYPAYLELPDFEEYLQSEAAKQINAADKKKGEHSTV